MRLGDDLFGGRDRFLLFALGHVAGAFARFVDHLLRLRIRLGQDFLVALLRFGELLLDLLGSSAAPSAICCRRSSSTARIGL